MSHIECLSQFLDSEDTNIEGKFRIDILSSLFKVNNLLLSIDDVPLIELQTRRDAITQRMYFFIRPSSSRPLDPP